VLPYLPFTTINLTEIAKWASSDQTVLKVNSGNLLALNPAQPSGSRSYATKLGTANNVASMRTSNSGVAVSTIIPSAVDKLGDEAEVSDAQPFKVGDSAIPTSGDEFFLRLSGGGTNPYAFYALGGDVGECIKPATGDRVCSTNTTFPFSGASGALRLEHYWAEVNQTQTFSIGATQCTVDAKGNKVTFGGGSFSVSAPAFQNYRVNSATVASGTGSITTGMPAGSSSDNTAAENTTLSFSGLSANARIDVGFTLESTRTDATIQACTVSYSSKAKSWSLTVTAWNKPWL